MATSTDQRLRSKPLITTIITAVVPSALTLIIGFYVEFPWLSPEQKASFGKTLKQLIAELDAEPPATGDVGFKLGF